MTSAILEGGQLVLMKLVTQVEGLELKMQTVLHFFHDIGLNTL